MRRYPAIIVFAVCQILSAEAMPLSDGRLLAGELAEAIDGPELCPQVEKWYFRPGNASQFEWIDSQDHSSRSVELTPEGKLLGLESERLKPGRDFPGSRPVKLSASITNGGIERGVFAFSIYCFDESGKPLKQHAFFSLNEKSATGNPWRVVGHFGPGSSKPYPPETASIAIRFSFYQENGDCRGKVQIRDVELQPDKTPGNAEWPSEIVADVDDLQVRFESRSFWTLYRIDYQGVRFGLDRFGSHYGSVVRFPSIGFIGSGHTENEDEVVKSLSLRVDGQPIDIPPSSITCEKIELEKVSQIRTLQLSSNILVSDGKIFETVELEAKEATPVSLIYHFMHPFTPDAESYLAETTSGKIIRGDFVGDRQQKIDAPTKWSSLYDSQTKTGAVTVVREAPEAEGHWRTRYWDIDGVYRKHYFTTFLNQTVPADRLYRYQIVTQPFRAEPDQWERKAGVLAEALSRAHCSESSQ